MTDGPVTVVIPNRNGAAYLAEAVGSALADPAVGSAVVVDDGSTDDSPRLLGELAARAGGRVRVLRQAGGGACVARNAGLAEAAGPFVKFLDADDALEPGAVTRQVGQMAAFAGEAVSVHGDAVWVDAAGDRLPAPPPVPPGLTEAERMILHAPLTSTPLHRVEDVRRVGGFDPRVPRGQEHDLHVRMWLAGVRFEYVPGPVYRYRQHAGPRISAADGDPAVARGRLESLLRHVDEAKARFGDPLPADLARAFARDLWRNGRRCLQAGAAEVAGDFFAAARDLAAGEAVVGGRAYRAVCRLAGPVWAERTARLRAARAPRPRAAA